MKPPKGNASLEGSVVHGTPHAPVASPPRRTVSGEQPVSRETPPGQAEPALPSPKRTVSGEQPVSRARVEPTLGTASAPPLPPRPSELPGVPPSSRRRTSPPPLPRAAPVSPSSALPGADVKQASRVPPPPPSSRRALARAPQSLVTVVNGDGPTSTKDLGSTALPESVILPEASLEPPPTEVLARGALRVTRKRALRAVVALVAVTAAAGAVFVTTPKRSANSNRPAKARAALSAQPRPAPTPEPEVTLSVGAPEATRTATAAAEMGEAESAKPGNAGPTPLIGSDGSDTRAPSCDDLLAGESQKPRDAALAYDHVREGHRELVRGSWDAAQRAFCRAIREPDAGPGTRLELAQALLLRRDSPAAALQAQEVLAADPTANRARDLLGDALVRTGETQAACNLWLAASKLSLANMGQRDFYEADQAALQHDFTRAERYYRRVVGCQPTHALAHAKLAATLAKLGQAKSAQRWAQRASELAPDDLAVRAAIPANLR